MDSKKLAFVAAAMIAAFVGNAVACPIEECMPELAKKVEAQEARDSINDLRDPAQAAMHAGLVAAEYRVAILEAENRALIRAVELNQKPDLASLRLFPSPHALYDAVSSDVLQVTVTGRMPQLEHFQRRVKHAVVVALIEEETVKLGKPRRLITPSE